MTIYEHTYIAAPEASRKDIDEIEKKISDILSKNSGKIHRTEDWGIRNLAYPIKKNNISYALECGPGKALTNMFKRFDFTINTKKTDTMEDLENYE